MEEVLDLIRLARGRLVTAIPTDASPETNHLSALITKIDVLISAIDAGASQKTIHFEVTGILESIGDLERQGSARAQEPTSILDAICTHPHIASPYIYLKRGIADIRRDTEYSTQPE